MASPRYQCLRAVRQVCKQSPSWRIFFSTSRTVQADQPPRPSATSDLLSVGDGIPSSSPFRALRSPPMFTNPIQIEKPNASSHDGLKRIMEISQRRAALRARESRQTTSADLSRLNNAAGLSRQITRRFKAGDVYAPHDLSEVEMKKWKQRSRPEKDVFDVLDFNPMDHYRNFSIMSEYMTPMGRIMHNKETGLRPVNQRRIARAIRRSIGMGLMPSVHRHPEYLHFTQKTTRVQMRSPTRGDVAPIF